MQRVYSIILCLLFFSCNTTKKKPVESQNKTEITTQEIKKVTNSIGEVLSPEARTLVNNWKEYKNIENVISEYYSITTKDATFKAHELVKLSQQLKDSIRIEDFKTPDVKTRLNVLYNNAMRLSDMDSIPEIENKEIVNQIINTLHTFSSINSKINNIINKKNLEKELEDFKIN